MQGQLTVIRAFFGSLIKGLNVSPGVGLLCAPPLVHLALAWVTDTLGAPCWGHSPMQGSALHLLWVLAQLRRAQVVEVTGSAVSLPLPKQPPQHEQSIANTLEKLLLLVPL